MASALPRSKLTLLATTAMGLGPSARYYEEVREGQIIPQGSLAQLCIHIGVGPGLCGVLDTSVNSTGRRARSYDALLLVLLPLLYPLLVAVDE